MKGILEGPVRSNIYVHSCLFWVSSFLSQLYVVIYTTLSLFQWLIMVWMVIPTKSQHIYLWSEATFIFGTENVSSQQNVGIDPNTFEVLNGHSNKIPTDKILEGVVQNCRKCPETGKTAEILWTLSVTEIPYSVYCLFCQPSNKKKLKGKEMLNFF